jgi:hypothetical protein
MTDIDKLAHELLLRILGHLESRDFDSLFKSQRELSGIAQEALHRQVYIEEPRKQILLLIRSLIERPDLARRVCTLAIPIENDYGNKMEEWKALICETATHLSQKAL